MKVVFSINPQNGAVLQTFAFDGANGNSPLVGVIQVADGTFMGTTELGGTISAGKNTFADGTVWTLDAGLPAPAPAITLLHSTSGSVGSTVLINGKNFIGTTAVSFNGVSASFRALNTQFVSATVPARRHYGSGHSNQRRRQGHQHTNLHRQLAGVKSAAPLPLHTSISN